MKILHKSYAAVLLLAAVLFTVAIPVSFSQTAPSPASGAGLTNRVLGPSVTLGTNWFVNGIQGGYLGSAVVQNGDGSVTLGGTGNGGITTIQSATGPATYTGKAYTGATYFEATMSVSGGAINTSHGAWPAFWANDVEIQATGAVTPTTQWPGQASNYGRWIENDIAEFAAGGTTLCTGNALHDWYNTVGSGVQVSTSFGNACLPAGQNISASHRYGFLWTPATSTTQGSAKYYIDDVLTNSVSWNQYSAAAIPPPIYGSTAFSVMDTRHMYPILSSGVDNPLTVTAVSVWQKPASGAESADKTTVTTVGPTIIDAGGTTFAISAGAQILINGTADTTTSNVIELAYVSHVLWQENAAGNWYNYLGTPGSYGGPTTTSPLNVSGTGKTSPPTPLSGSVTPQTWASYDQNFAGVTLTSGKPFHFNVLPPAQYNAASYKYPLHIWLHPDGSGNAWYTGGNTNPLFYVPNEPANFNTVSFLTNYPAVTAVPYADQTCSQGSAVCNWGGWTNNGTTGSGTNFSGDTGPNTFALLAMITYLESIYSIDTNRIYVDGFSLGGIGSEYLLQKYNAYNGNPAIFAAGVSTGGVLEINGFGVGPTTANATTMANVPVWWFSGANDGTSIPADWNLPMWRLEAGNSSYPSAITSPAANRAGTSQMHFTLCPTCGHQSTDSAGNPVSANATIMNWMFGTLASVTPTGTGRFTVSNGGILDPNGQPYVPFGININSELTGFASTSSSATPLLTLFPGLNFVRIPFHSYDAPSTIATFVTQLTNRHIVVEIEDHTSIGQPPYTGSAATTQLAWYTSMATAFKANPYVWFGTQNESYPASSGSGNDVSVMHKAIYDAVRNAGNTTFVLMNLIGGGNPCNLPGGGCTTLTAATYAAMTNIMWEWHCYNWPTGYSGDPVVIANFIANSTTAIRTVRSADGLMPLGIFEFGPSTTGNLPDDNGGVTLVAKVGTSGFGSAAWAWDAYGTSDKLVNNGLSAGTPSLTTFGVQEAAIIAAGASPTSSETLSISTLPSVAANTAFTVSGSVVGAGSTPVLQYQNNNGAWTALPSGSSISQIAFSFIDPGLATPGTSGNVVRVRDANTTSIVATSNAFTVTGAESSNNAIVTATLTAPTFTDNFATLPLHRTWQAGDNWQLIAPDTTDGRGGPNFSESGDQWWTNPLNPSTPISGIYNQDSSGLHLGLLQTPAAQQAYITTTSGAALAYVGGLLNTSQTNYQKYGYWETTVAVPRVPGFTFQADAENVQITGTWPPEIDLRISTDASNVQTVLFQFALGGGVYTQYTTSSTSGFDATRSHTYAWDWEVDFITFYIDGSQVAQYANPSAAYQTNPMFLFILSAANYIGTGDPAAAALPVSANVTSVNIYATKPAAVSSGSVIDATGEVWTITASGQVAVNGVPDSTTSSVIELAYVSHAVWYETSGGLWRFKTKASDTWQPAAGTATSPLTIAESPNGTDVVTVGPTITDSHGTTFSISSGGQVLINGVADAVTNSVVELAYVNHVLWQKNSGGSWYSYLGTPGSYAGPSTSPLTTEAFTINTIGSQVAGINISVSGAISGVSVAPTMQYTTGGTTTSTGCSSAIATPSPALTVGYNCLIYGPNISVNNTVGPASYPNAGPAGTTNNWYPFTFYGSSWLGIGFTRNADSSVTLDGTGEGVNGYGLTTAALNGTSSGNRISFTGQTFGGGFYAQVVMKGTGPMAFWSNDIETMNGVSISPGAGLNPWPGQANGYGDWFEGDFAEFDCPQGQVVPCTTTPLYGVGTHNWYNGSAGGPGNLDRGTNYSKIPVTPAIVNNNYNTYGVLWVPATTTAQGYLESYFCAGVNCSPVKATHVSWDKYNPANTPPPFDATANYNQNVPWPTAQVGGGPGTTAFSILDQLHLALIISGYPSSTTQFQSVAVWQANGQGDLPVIPTSTTALVWTGLPAGSSVSSTSFSFTIPGLPVSPTNTIGVRDAVNTTVSATSNGFAVNAATGETLTINALPAEPANAAFTVTGTISGAAGAGPSTNFAYNPGQDGSYWKKPFQSSANWITTGPLITALRGGTPTTNVKGNYGVPWVTGISTDPLVQVTDGTRSINVHIPLGTILEGPTSAVDQSIGGADATQPYLVWSISGASMNTGSVQASGSVITGTYGFSIQDGAGLIMVDAVTGVLGSNNSLGGIQDYELAQIQADPNYVIQHMLAFQMDPSFQASSAGPIWPLNLTDTSGGPYNGPVPQGVTIGIPANQVMPAGKTRAYKALWDQLQQFGMENYNFGGTGGANFVIYDQSGAYGSLVSDLQAAWVDIGHNYISILNYANGTSGAQYSLATTKGAVAGSTNAFPAPPPLDLSPTGGVNVAPSTFGAWYQNTGYTATPTNPGVASGSPVLQYQDGSGAWQALPGGSTVSSTTFSFVHPGMSPTTSTTLSVRDANNTTAVATVTFSVTGTIPGGTTWNPADTSATVALSGSNLIATSTAAVAGGTRSATPQSAGKFCFQIPANVVTPNMSVGISNTAFALSGASALGANANSIGFYPAQPSLLQGALYNGVQVLRPVISFLTPTSGGTLFDNAGNAWTLLSDTNMYINGNVIASSHGTGKVAIVNNVIYAQDVTTLAWFTYAPATTTGTFTAATAPVLPVASTADVSGDIIMICDDLTAQREWISTPVMRAVAGVVWNSGAIASQNPATGTGGASFSGLTCPCYVTMSTTNVATQGTLNTAGPFALTLPVGFQAWQSAPVILHHPFLFNFGQNTPANDNALYLPARFESIAR